MVPKKPGVERAGGNETLRSEIGKLFERAMRQNGEGVSPSEARLMLGYLTEQGKIREDAKQAVSKIAESFPVAIYEQYVNTKLSGLGMKATKVDARILDEETIAALRVIAESDGQTTAAPVPETAVAAGPATSMPAAPAPLVDTGNLDRFLSTPDAPKNNTKFLDFAGGIAGSLDQKSDLVQTILKTIIPAIGKRGTAVTKAQTVVQDFYDPSYTGNKTDGIWGTQSRIACYNYIVSEARKISGGSNASLGVPSNVSAPTKSATETPAADNDRYVPISEASTMQMPDVKIREGKIFFNDLDNESFDAFASGKNLAELKNVKRSFYRGTFSQTAEHLEKEYGIKDAGLFITNRTQIRAFELALSTRIRDMESGIPGYAVMLADLADFNDDKNASRDDKISTGTENLLFARFIGMEPSQVRSMLLSAGTSVEDYQRDAKGSKDRFRIHYQMAGNAQIADGAIRTNRIAEFSRAENQTREAILRLYSANKSDLEKIAAGNANIQKIIRHLPDNISRESFMQMVFLEYAGIILGATNGAAAKFDISRLGLFFDSLTVGVTDRMFGVAVSKKFALTESGSVRGEAGLMNFLPFGSIQADAYKSDPEARDFFSKNKLEGQVRVTPFAMLGLVSAVGVTVMFNEKNPEILAQTERFANVMTTIVEALKNGKEPDLSKLSGQDQSEFAILIDTFKRLNTQMGGKAYDRLLSATVMAYKVKLTEENAGMRFAGVNLALAFKAGMIASLLSANPVIGTVAMLLGMVNIERTGTQYESNENTHTQAIEYALTRAPREMRLFNRGSVVMEDGSKIPAILLNRNEVTAIDTPSDQSIKIYKTPDGYAVTGAEKSAMSIVNFDSNRGRAKILTFGEPKSRHGTLAYDPYNPTDLPSKWRTEISGSADAASEASVVAAENSIHARLREALGDTNVSSVLAALDGFNVKADSFDLRFANLFSAGARGDRKSFDAAWTRFVSNVRTDAKWAMIKPVLTNIEAIATKGYDHKRVILEEVFNRFMITRADAGKIGVTAEEHAKAVETVASRLGTNITTKLNAHLTARPDTALDSLPTGIPEGKRQDAREYLRLKLPIAVFDSTAGTASNRDDRQAAFSRRMAEAGIPANESKRVQEIFNRDYAGKESYTGEMREIITDGFILPVSSRLNPVFRGMTPMMGAVTLATVGGRTVDIPMQQTTEIRKAVVAAFPESLITELAKSLKMDAKEVRNTLERADSSLLTFDVSYTKWGACGNDACRVRNIRIGGQRVAFSFSQGSVTVMNTLRSVGSMYGIGAAIDASGTFRTPSNDTPPPTTTNGTGTTGPESGTGTGTIGTTETGPTN
ncbi:MAG TPA: hypothetical protein PK765_00385 [bacterium]|nr:hypothetical protein [bacterium]